MAIPNKQIGWSQENNLLWEISKELDKILCLNKPCITTTSTTTVFCNITIGEQSWACRNLNVTTYRNGDVIPEVTDPTEWYNLTTGAWCYYDNDPANEAVYGKLYNWYAVNDVRGLAPIGFHIPTDVEFSTLVTFLGGELTAGGEMKETGTTHWSSPNTDATNSSNFTGLPGGKRNLIGEFSDITNYGTFWSSTAGFGVYAKTAQLYFNTAEALLRDDADKHIGFSVRCIID